MNYSQPKIVLPLTLESRNNDNTNNNLASELQDRNNSLPNARDRKLQFQGHDANPHLSLITSLERSQSDSLPNSPMGKLPRPRSEKNVLSASIPKHIQTGLARKISSRIDPTQVPRPGKYHKETVFHTRSSSGRKNPPSVNAIYVGVDNGNSLPQHLRSTMVAPPCTKELFDKMELPFCLISTPFSSLHTGEEEIPQIEMPYPPRCSKCLGYVNPSVQFTQEGKKWICSLCLTENNVPDWYYSPLDGSGLRQDRMKRPELCKGSVEYLVGPEYAPRLSSKVFLTILVVNFDLIANQGQSIVFAIDISYEAYLRGVTAASVNAVKKAVSSLSERCSSYNQGIGSNYHQASAWKESQSKMIDFQISLVGFSSQIYFYDVNLAAHETVQILIAESDDPFPALPTNKLFYSVTTQYAELDHLLNSRFMDLLEKEYVQSLTINDDPGIISKGTCPTAVIAALKQAVGKCGGKLYIFTSNHSTAGAGQHSSRQKDYLYGIPEEFLMYSSPPVVDSNTPVALTYLSSNPILAPFPIQYPSSTNLSSNSNPHTPTILSTLASQQSFKQKPTPSVENSGLRGEQPAWKEKISQCYDFYRDLGTKCLHANVAVSIFYFISERDEDKLLQLNNSYGTDLTLLGEIPKITGGKLFLCSDPLLPTFPSQVNTYLVPPPIHSIITPPESTMPVNQFASLPPLSIPPVTESPLPHLSAVFSAVVELQLTHDLEDWIGSDSILKLRTSSSVRVERVVASGQFDSIEEIIHQSEMSRSSTMLFDCKVVRDITDEGKMHFQLAVLFTTVQQQRVLRVHNLTLIASSKGTVIFRNCDVEVIAVAMAKLSTTRSLQYSLSDEKEGPKSYLQNKAIQMLVQYRKLCSTVASPRGQLILPESLKTLPMYCLGMLKHPFLIENMPFPAGSTPTSKPSVVSNVLVTANERYYQLLRIISAPIRDVLNSIYPRVYSLFAAIEDPLSIFDENIVLSTDSLDDSLNESSNNTPTSNAHNMSSLSFGLKGSLSRSYGSMSQFASSVPLTPSSAAQAAAGGGGISLLNDKAYFDKLKISQSINPSSENFESDQVYVIDDRRILWLYVGRSVPQDLLEQIFDFSSSASSSSRYDRPERIQLNVRTKLGSRADEFLRLIANDGPYQLEMRTIWADSQTNMLSIHKFTSRLVEDANNGTNKTSH